MPSLESVGLNLLRRIEGRAATGRLLKARIEMHPELAEAVQNGRRREFARLEAEYDIEIEIVASHRLHGPEEQIEWRDRPSANSVAPLQPAQIRERRAESASGTAPIVFGRRPMAKPRRAAAGRRTAKDGRTARSAAAAAKNRRGKRDDKGSPVLSSELSVLFAEGDLEETGGPEVPDTAEDGREPTAQAGANGAGGAEGPNGGSAPRKRRRRGGRRRNGRRPEDGGGRVAEARGDEDEGPRVEADNAPKESVEARIARIAASFAPTI
ncbi:MAG: hypothetical protein R2862_07935 [Thermoanaerobaculia bacterium]